MIIGPTDTPFEDGTFRLVMHFEEQYPNKPPGVKFISQMFHPNVYGTGELCLDILQNRWSPTYDVAAILTSIQRYQPRHQDGYHRVCCIMGLTILIACSTTQTPLRLPTLRLQTFIRTTEESIRSEYGRLSKRAGKIEMFDVSFFPSSPEQRSTEVEQVSIDGHTEGKSESL